MIRAINPKNVEEWAIEKHNGVFNRMLVEGQNITVMWSRWEPGASAPEHAHPHEQVAVCLEGEFIFTVNGEECVLRAGEFIYIPPNAPHAERNDGHGTAVLTDFFSPIRLDLHERRFKVHILEEGGK
jgi:quercetin dioxygenase-like cupin family protein